MIDPKPSRKVRKAQQRYGLSAARARAALENEKTIACSEEKLAKQRKSASARSHFGPRGKAAPVIVRNLETGEILSAPSKAPKKPKKPKKQQERRTALGVDGQAPKVVTPPKRKMDAAEEKEFCAAVKEAERARLATGRLHYVFKSHRFDSAADPYADPYADLADKATWDVRPL